MIRLTQLATASLIVAGIAFAGCHDDHRDYYGRHDEVIHDRPVVVEHRHDEVIHDRPVIERHDGPDVHVDLHP